MEYETGKWLEKHEVILEDIVKRLEELEKKVTGAK